MTVNIFKDRSSYIVRVMTLPLMSVYLCLYIGQLEDDPSAIQDRSGIIYIVVSTAPMTGVLNVAALCRYNLTHTQKNYNDRIYCFILKKYLEV